MDRYPDIITVYSSQGSQYDNVHVHTKRFKGKRNLLYRACSRAAKKLKISDLDVEDGGLELRDKMELHPKSVLWQVEVGAASFPEERVRAAQLEVLQKSVRAA